MIYSKRVGMRKVFATFMIAVSFPLLFSCDSDSGEPDPNPAPDPNKGPAVIVKPATVHQEMIGFGGALTWYSDRVVSSSKKDELFQLMFSDLGMDILRLKNWYYPQNYPTNKSPENMLTAGDKTTFEATKTFFAKAKEMNPNVQVLLSAWGPPPALKSNNSLRQGTLKKDDNGFMYNAFADYWVDVLDNIGFNPEYISIQNEPGYENAGWTTCKWSPSETSSLAGYDQAFDAVYNKIKDRPNRPVMIGPEAENVQAFSSFARVVKDKASCPIYSYHPYNFNAGTDPSQTAFLLNDLYSQFNNKPNIMTEYSGMSWFKTARFIHRTMRHANTSGYIYWELVWGNAATKDQAMIYIDEAGNYTVNPMYYVIKHFSKFIDKGYKRVEVASTAHLLEVTGYMNPAQNKLTLVIINPDSFNSSFKLEVEGKQIKSAKAYRSVEGDYFKDLGAVSTTAELSMPKSSITTLVLDL